jgi:long-chain acyl-CoA synthetase
MPSSVIRCADRTRTRDELLARAARIAAGLGELGIQRGDRVAIVLRNDIEFIEASLGAALAGMIPVPVNWHWRGTELGHLLTDSDAKLAFVHTDLLPAVREAVSSAIPIMEVRPSEALRAAYRLPDLPEPSELELESWLAEHPAPIDAPLTPPLSVIYTSGTTGKPKGILRQPMTPEQSQSSTKRIFDAFGLTPGQSTLVPAPMYHSAPNVHALFAVAAGHDLTIMPRYSPEEFLATIERNRIQHTQMVPTMFVRLLQLPEERRRSYDLSSLASVVHAAAPCAPDIKRQMIEWWGPIIREYYGSSETGTVVGCDSKEWLEHPGTVGRALPGCDVKILDETGAEVRVGEYGEIFVSPGTKEWPSFTYIGNQAARDEMERDGYLTAGDGGWLDADGFLYLGDRIKDMVISGGVNIYPAEIEQCLITLPGVRDVAVLGIPDPDYGESLAAHVDTDPDSGLTEDDIRAHVRENLAGYKVPKVVVIDRELPREESGKLYKRRIRERYLNS